jgi:hypothetical protein
MQHGYVGDIGDYGKYGLIRYLVGRTRQRLGVVWYLVANEDRGDGGFVGYLNSQDQLLERCDPELFGMLRSTLSHGTRSLKAIQRSNVLPKGTVFVSNEVPRATGGDDCPRSRWLRDAARITASCDLVFLDPDNGLECKSVAVTHRQGRKYVYYDELARFIQNGSSLLIYHHTNRQGPATLQVRDRARYLRALFPKLHVRAVLYRRGSVRAYFLLGQKQHVSLLTQWDSFQETDWSEHFESM